MGSKAAGNYVKLRDVINVEDPAYGAVGDDATDNTTAFQNALTDVQNNAAAKLWMPPGTFIVGELDWPGNNITLAGAGSGYTYNTNGTPRTTLKAKAGATNVLDLVQTGTSEDRTGNHLVDFCIDGASNAAVGVKCAGANILERLCVKGCTTAGVELNNFTNSTHIMECGLISNSGYGLKAVGVSATRYSVSRTLLSLNSAGGARLETGFQVNFDDVLFESNGSTGLEIYKPNTHTNLMGFMLFRGCWFEDNNDAAASCFNIDAETRDEDHAPEHIKFEHCHMSVSSVSNDYLEVLCGKDIEFDHPHFSGSNQADPVSLEANAYRVALIEQFGLTDAQVDTAIASGTKCWWHNRNTKRVVGAGSPAAGFINSWVNFGSPFPSAAYWFDRDGNVHVEGTIKSGTATNPAFTLPAGYRPADLHGFAVDDNGAHGLLYVETDGDVVPYVASAAAFHLHAVFSPG